ncbi:unnamed protein product, partial [Mesorhabditis spiculigera]
MNNSGELEPHESEGIDEELHSIAQDLAEGIRQFAGFLVFVLKLGEMLNEECPDPLATTITLNGEDDAYLADDYDGWEHSGDCVTENQKANAILEQYNLKVGPFGNSGESFPPCSNREQKIDAINEQFESSFRDPPDIPSRVTYAAFSTPDAKARFNEAQRQIFNARQAKTNRGCLHARIPSGFNFTSGIVDNSGNQGLLHTMLRHSSQWQGAIPGYGDVYGKLSKPLKKFVREMSALSGDDSKARNLDEPFWKLLDREDAGNDYKLFQKLQELIYDYLCSNMTTSSYAGEGANDHGYVQGVIMDSNAHQGLLHTILRHSPDWVAVSSEYEAVYDSLSSLTKEKMAAIAAISKNQNRKAQLLCAAFMGYILSDMGHQDRQALHRLQTIVYNYLLKKIKEDTYSGEGVSKTGRVRIFFDAADEGESDDAGENREEDVEYMDYMVICRSEERDRAIPELGDDRQVVSVITIYFIDHKKEEETFLADDYNGWEHPGNCTSRARKSEAIQQYRDAVESRIYAPRRNGRAGAALTRLEAIIQFDKHKRENGEAARQAFKKRSLLEVPMPSGFESTCAILDNNGYQGLLHTILRHSPEWKDVAPGYANIYQRLSEQTRAAISKISHLADNNQKLAQQMIKEFKKSLGTMPANDCKILQNLQGIIYDYLCKTINARNYAGEGANPSDFVQFFFQESGNASIGYMVVCISKTVDGSVPKFDDPRPVSNINTIYFVDEHTLRGRKVSECFSSH